MEDKMARRGGPTQYEATGIRAVGLMDAGMTPEDAWDKAAHECCGTLYTATKPCPKGAFLGLVYGGILKSRPVPTARAKITPNMRYAQKGYELALTDHSLFEQPEKLWKFVMEGEPKEYNRQFHVLRGLWRAQMLVCQ